jgi:signal transduction histidine kinase
MPLIDTIIVAFIGTGSLLLSTIFLAKNRRRLLYLISALLSFSIGIWIVTAYLSDMPSLQSYSLFLNRFLLTAVTTVIVSMFYLAFTFPIQTKIHPFLNFLILFIGAVICIATVTTPYTIQSIKFESWGTDPVYGWLYTIFSIYLSILLIAATAKFILVYRQVKGLHKLQMKYLFFGIFNFMLINLVVHVVISQIMGSVEYYKFGNYSAVFFVVFLSIAIAKHRLMDIRLIIARTVAYIMLVVIFGLTYIVAAYSLETYLLASQIDINQLILSTGITIVLLFSFQPMRRIVDITTRKIFFKDEYSTENMLSEIGEMIRKNIRLTPLINPILKHLATTLHIENIQLITKQEENIISKKYGNILLENSPKNLFETLYNISDSSVIIFDEQNESSKKEFLRNHSIGALIPLRTSIALNGFLILGEKKSGEAFSSQDIGLMEILAPQLSIAIQNAIAYEEISQFNETLKEEVDKATTDLKQANKHLKHLDKLKDEFVFIATHELKNPVTAMRGYLSLLQEGSFGQIPDQMKDAFNQLQASNQQLVELVNDLLQIARSEAKTLTVQTQPVELKPIIESVVQSLKPISDQKALTITYAPRSDVPSVLADAQRVKEITNNLISNAIKYSDTGAITVSHEIQDGLLITHVADQGVGISYEDQTKLFTRFYRVEEEAAKGIPGTGLGLFIVKQLLEKMGGSIWLKSAKDQGSTFSFSLPLA